MRTRGCPYPYEWFVDRKRMWIDGGLRFSGKHNCGYRTTRLTETQLVVLNAPRYSWLRESERLS